ncbi:MAG TPA: nuclear transport factor 2 family protein [Gemmatimonadales bacterium]|nr:nuclear transport factor 2 family protein [Gemmatimonadales bacterium]
MTNVALIQRILDEAFATLDFHVLAGHLAEDVVFEVTPPGEADVIEARGRDAVVDYFTSLGDIVSFWRVRCYGDGERVVAVGAERFTIPRGVTLGGEFALLLHVCGEQITRFFIIEDLSRAPELEAAAFEGGRF